MGSFSKIYETNHSLWNLPPNKHYIIMKASTFALALLVLSCAIMKAYGSDEGPCTPCYALNAKCLACSAQKTIADFCAANPAVVGCEAREKGRCCYALTAVCMACNQGESLAQFCANNPKTEGCASP